jgi:hypothetical protein
MDFCRSTKSRNPCPTLRHSISSRRGTRTSFSTISSDLSTLRRHRRVDRVVGTVCARGGEEWRGRMGGHEVDGQLHG